MVSRVKPNPVKFPSSPGRAIQRPRTANEPHRSNNRRSNRINLPILSLKIDFSSSRNSLDRFYIAPSLYFTPFARKAAYYPVYIAALCIYQSGGRKGASCRKSRHCVATTRPVHVSREARVDVADKRTRSAGESATCAQTWLCKAIYVAASLLRKDQGWRDIGVCRGCEGREGSVVRDGTGAL